MLKGKSIVCMVVLCITILAASVVAGKACASEENPTMTLILKSLGSNFWVQIKVGAEHKAAELGVDLKVLAPSSDNATEDQIRMLEDQLIGDVDAVIIAPSNSNAQLATFRKLGAENIPMVFVDTNSKAYEEKVAFIGSSNTDVGYIAGKYIADNVDKSGAVIVLRGQLGDETADMRTGGFEKAMAEAGVENVVVQPANNDRNVAMGVMENMLHANDHVVAVYGTNDEMALGAARAVIAAGASDAVLVVGTNADVDALSSIVKGEGVDASIRQDPYAMGATAVDTAFRHLKGETMEKEIIVPVRVIDSKDAKETLASVMAVLEYGK